jgi:hypothetical protein
VTNVLAGQRDLPSFCSRYIGLAKTHLQMVATAVAINLHRLFDWWEQKPRAKTRISSFAQLAPNLAHASPWWASA